ncbi:unnamed protein product, partial [Prunus brigantina]
ARGQKGSDWSQDLAPEHHPCYRLIHPIYHTTVALRATPRSTAQNPPPTPPLNGLVAQAVNLTAEIGSSLGHNHCAGTPAHKRIAFQKKDVTCSRISPRPGAPGCEICD